MPKVPFIPNRIRPVAVSVDFLNNLMGGRGGMLGNPVAKAAVAGIAAMAAKKMMGGR